jgi:DNA-binding IscR family transcriptional regulator
MSEWTFLTNHARALLCIAGDPGVRLRDIAEMLDITERSAYTIVNDLAAAGYVLKERDGRRNRYVVQRHLPLPETTARERTVGEVLELLIGGSSRTRRAPAQRGPRRAHVNTTTKSTRRASGATQREAVIVRETHREAAEAALIEAMRNPVMSADQWFRTAEIHALLAIEACLARDVKQHDPVDLPASS